MTKLLSTILILLGLSQQAAASLEQLKLFPLSHCPAVGEEFGNLISKLDTIKASIKDGANCTNVALKVKSLEDLVVKDRQKIREILDSANGQPLTPEQTELVRNYSEEVTKKVASLYDLFSGSNACFRDDKVNSGLESLGAFVNEASRLVTSLTGPWGTPIALAGNVVAGFLTGLDQVMKSRAGYDFTEPGDWKGYVQNLCTFHGYRDQIAHLLDPKGRLNQLKGLKQRLDDQIEILSKRCEECEKIHRDHKILGHAVNDDVARADARFARPYGTFMLFTLGIRDWVTAEILRVEKDARSYWAEISGRHLLSSARSSLEQFLIHREAPRFLQYQSARAADDFGRFENFALREGRSLYHEFYSANRHAVKDVGYYFIKPLNVFRTLLIEPIAWERVPADRQDELRYAWAHFRDRGVARLRDAEASLQVVQGFCSFFQQAGYYSQGVRSACTSPSNRTLAEQMSALERDLAATGVGTGVHIDIMAFEADTTVSVPRTGIESVSRLLDQLSRL